MAQQQLNWRRLHWLTPLTSAWKTIAALLAFFTYQTLRDISRAVKAAGTNWSNLFFYGMLVFAGLLLVIAIYSFIAWRMMGYAITDEAVHYKWGVLMRNERQIKLSRLAAVDITLPLLGRIFGLGYLRIEAAGGDNSHILLGLLPQSDLEGLRAELLARAAGLRVGAAPTDANVPASSQLSEGEDALPTTSEVVEQPLSRVARRQAQKEAAKESELTVRTSSFSAPVAPETELFRLPNDLLFRSTFRSMGFVVNIVLLVVLIIAIVVGAFWLDLGQFLEALSANVVVIFVIISSAVGFLWQRLNKEFGFRLAFSPDGIRLHRGLTETRAQTIPPGRIHAIKLSQQLLWRKPNWWRVEIVTPGYSGGEDAKEKTQSNVLLPVADEKTVRGVLEILTSDMEVENPEDFWAEALHGTREKTVSFTANPPRSRIFDWFSFRRNAMSLTPMGVVTRHGWTTHAANLVFYEHIQSVGLSQGPWERKRGLADLQLHLVPGGEGFGLNHVDADYCLSQWEYLAQASQQRREKETPGVWLRRAKEVAPELEAITEETDVQ
ncbi:hypothetical protein BK816_06825 [Boudabousia tangfeifanii]|uniref:YdbS-like PH domain-containing protein n=1 Tax=Boudabousia tangfeifanii TaxID=1912795 RepID=A0A1D9ML45_9ACTO|nr:PH domain-containing protein [Boudabousia tangfeifanii]AOZ73034.1 hypothetical protein BK816_06825 [Boudabousia tangfeifanii]